MSPELAQTSTYGGYAHYFPVQRAGEAVQYSKQERLHRELWIQCSKQERLYLELRMQYGKEKRCNRLMKSRIAGLTRNISANFMPTTRFFPR
jgi:hypothetical protein